MTTVLPPVVFHSCSECVPQMEQLTEVVGRRFQGPHENPVAFSLRGARVLTTGAYPLGVLHQNGHPASYAEYAKSRESNPKSITRLNKCNTCLDKKNWAAHRFEHFFPGFAAEDPDGMAPREGISQSAYPFPEWVGGPGWLTPRQVATLCRVMHWLGVLHALEHPVALTDYAEAIKTGDFSIKPPANESD